MLIEVRQADPFSAEARALVEDLWRELGILYGDSGPCQFQPEDVSGDRCVFVAAYRDGVAVGCGAVVPVADADDTLGEVKRMFVEEWARGNGISRLLLQHLESLAREAGFRVLRLETALRQPAAIHVYETSGYSRTAPFGKYADDPLTVCFEKRL